MIPAPTISDVLKMFGEETNPIPREKIVANYGDPSLVSAYLPWLIDQGFINRTDEGYFMSNQALDQAIDFAEKRVQHFKSLKA